MLLLKKITAVLVTVSTGYITFYNPVGKNLFCQRILGEPPSRWKYNAKMSGIAHRWLPCGTEVYLKVGGKTIKTRVVDRGPYGAYDDNGKYVVASPRFLKNWWKKYYEMKKLKISESELDELSRELPSGWKWRCIADILYSLKSRLKTKGGRQAGILLVEKETWEKVKNFQPKNDECSVPSTN